MRTKQQTIIDKILDAHTVHVDSGRVLLYVDRIILADTAMPALEALTSKGHKVRNPAQTLLISDHYAPTRGPSLNDIPDEATQRLVARTESSARTAGIPVFGVGDARQGIQHGVSIEQGYAQPGLTLAAADSHSSTQGAVGALALSIGPNLPHVLTTQCLWLKRPRTLRFSLDGRLRDGVVAKDVALTLVARIGANGASGHVVEYAGSFIRGASIDARMTICNLSAEMGAAGGIVSPDPHVIDYVASRPLAPSGAELDQALAFWRSLPTDPGAVFDRDLALDVSAVAPMVTWGNSTADAIPVDGVVPDPENESAPVRRAQMRQSLDYMGLSPSTPLTDIKIDQVFIGSCANSQIEDLRAAASLLRGRRVAVPTLVVPGSTPVKLQAEAEGIAAIFAAAGAIWAESSCSMCVSMNGDAVAPGARCASTSNRNHVGRQGRGSRTHLVSPLTAAATALSGRLADVRDLDAGHATL